MRTEQRQRVRSSHQYTWRLESDEKREVGATLEPERALCHHDSRFAPGRSTEVVRPRGVVQPSTVKKCSSHTASVGWCRPRRTAVGKIVIGPTHEGGRQWAEMLALFPHPAMHKKPSIKRLLVLGGLASLCLALYADIDIASAVDEPSSCYVSSGCLARVAIQNVISIKREDLLNSIKDLVRADQFDYAVAMAGRLDRNGSQQFDWKQANDDIVIGTIAARSWASPREIADLAPLEKLLPANRTDGLGLADYLHLTADRIIHRSSSAGLEVGLADLFEPRTLHRGSNATLTAILKSRWPRAIEELPENQQGDGWNDLASIWLALGDRNAARKSLEQAERTGLVDYRGVQRIGDLTARTWLQMGEPARALQSAERASTRATAATLKFAIAHAYVAAGDIQRARDITTSALADVRKQPDWPWASNLLRDAVLLRMEEGDVQGARAIAKEIEAGKPGIVPASHFLDAAQAFNDVGDYARATALLKPALASVPGSNQFVGVGATLGPITGASLGLNESLTSAISVELYRSGNTLDFEKVATQLGPWYQKHAWMEVCAIRGQEERPRPDDDTCANKTDGAVLAGMAVNAINRQAAADADRYISRIVAIVGDENSVAAVKLALDAARLAVVRGRKEVVNAALVAAAHAADRLSDSGDRARELLEVAALRHELGYYL